MEVLLNELADKLVPAMIALSILLGMLISAIKHVVVSISHERSRREIAAYIASGAMSAEQGERLIKATIRSSSGGCAV